jgi:protein-glutamine gamma-glutamyltransferase
MNPSRTPALSEPPLSRRAVALTLLSYIGAVLLNLHHAAVWCAPVALLAAGWCWRVTLGRQRLPTRALRLATVVVLTLAVLGSFRTLNGVAAGATLLVVMGALKLLETRRVRDWLVMIAVAVFLLLAACLDHESLWLLPLYAAEVWLSCAALYAIGAGGVSLPVAALGRASGRGLLLALPLAVLLFVFFPRLPGSFWGVPRSDEAVTGLGEEMSPGSISQLSESDDVALRVRFDGPLPPPQQRYWRGPVMHDFDGYTWRRRRDEFAFQPQVRFTGPVYRYQITLEPSPQNVLIALELPVGLPSTPPNAFFTFDYQLLAPRPNTLAVTYALESAPAHENAGALSALGRRLDLELPSGRNPRARALAGQLRARRGERCGLRRRGAGLFPPRRLQLHADAGAPQPQLGGRFPLQHARGLLRPLRLGLRQPDARRRRAGPRDHRLSGR